MSETAKKFLLYLVVAMTFGLFYELVAMLTLERSGVASFFTSWDAAIPFIPETALFYLSLYVLFWLPPILSPAVKYKEFKTMAVATLAVFGASFVVYLACPFAYPRPNLVAPQTFYESMVFDFLYRIDCPNNSLPSTHAAVATLMPLFMIGKIKAGYAALYAFWGLMIALSTLTVKQHYLLDVISGMALAVIIFFIAARTHKTKSPRS